VPHEFTTLGLAFLAAVGAGFVNALAGGGTLISFPVLIFLGLPPVSANVTNTVALLPGYFSAAWAQRTELEHQKRRLMILVPVALLGGLVGALALLSTSDQLFSGIVPWLIYLAVALLAIQTPVRRFLSARRAARGAFAERFAAGAAAASRGPGPVAILAIGAAAIYGGYFGAGVSVIILATLGLTLDDDLVNLNALKQALSLAANLAAAVWFAICAPVTWPIAAAMALGAIGGGVAGGALSRHVKPGLLKAIVLAAGLISATWFLLKR
jgi:uncharacterized membrane protein YfcA